MHRLLKSKYDIFSYMVLHLAPCWPCGGVSCGVICANCKEFGGALGLHLGSSRFFKCECSLVCSSGFA